MCNQTEAYLEMYKYDRRADKGLEHVRGVAHDPATCGLCQKNKREGGKLVGSYYKRYEI